MARPVKFADTSFSFGANRKQPKKPTAQQALRKALKKIGRGKGGAFGS